MLALSVVAAIIGLMIGARMKLLGLAIGAVAMIPVSQASAFVEAGSALVERFGSAALALAVFQFAALTAMLIRHLTVGPTPKPARTAKASGRVDGLDRPVATRS